jgi:hypothetical protein
MREYRKYLAHLAFRLANIGATSGRYDLFEREEHSMREVNMDDLRESREERLISRGLIRFTYPDGLECIAINRKNADRKHNNYLKGNEHG